MGSRIMNTNNIQTYLISSNASNGNPVKRNPVKKVHDISTISKDALGMFVVIIGPREGTVALLK
jgi:hypothetical protein